MSIVNFSAPISPREISLSNIWQQQVIAGDANTRALAAIMLDSIGLFQESQSVREEYYLLAAMAHNYPS